MRHICAYDNGGSHQMLPEKLRNLLMKMLSKSNDNRG